LAHFVGAEWLGESHEGSPFSHLNNNILHLHMMNTTMNRQERKTVHTDMNNMMISLQLHNLILGSNFKSKNYKSQPKQTTQPLLLAAQLALKRLKTQAD
jgi:hypothetical protein